MFSMVSAECALMPPNEVMAATSTVYSALGTKSCSVTLVLEVFTVVLLESLSWYLTLYPSIVTPHTMNWVRVQDTLAELQPLASTITPDGGSETEPAKIEN